MDPMGAAAAKRGEGKKGKKRAGPLVERFAVSSKTITPLCARHVQLTIASRGIVHLSSGPTPCPLNDDGDDSEGLTRSHASNRVTSRVVSRQITVCTTRE